MEVLILFIITLGLAMDCFTIAITNSSVSGLVKPGIPLKVAVAFAFAHLVLLFLGNWIGGLLQPMFTGVESWVAFVILVIIGLKMISEVRRRHPKSKVFDINEPKVIVILSLATAMDAFLAGLVLGITSLSVYAGGILLTVTVFILTLAGMAGGEQLGMTFAKRTGTFGGAFLLIAAAVFLFQFIL